MRSWEALWPALGTIPDTSRFADATIRQLKGDLAFLLVEPRASLVCIDFNDVRYVLAQPGHASLGMGEASGEWRVREAAGLALASFLAGLEGVPKSIGAVVLVTGPVSLTVKEVVSAINPVRERFGDDDIVLAGMFDEELGDRVRVILIGIGKA
jgi:cell division protein FtsZ